MDKKEMLLKKLRELFRVESEDLDFGIYRVLNYKRAKINQFLNNHLLNEIASQLSVYGEDAQNGVIEELQNDVYNHLVRFFSRYYENGDFISKRRYGKTEKYVVPYNGEEVLLYWANKDQYYIKTTEHFRKYAFQINDLTVNFSIVRAEEEKGNVKAQHNKFFVLNDKIFDYDDEKRVLNIYFEYRGLKEGEKYGNRYVQERINAAVFKTLKRTLGERFEGLFEIVSSDKKDYKKYLLGKHIYNYTRRNTTDYFIHKNLKNFLERELDFYIKNEFLQLSDLEVLERREYFTELKSYLIGVRAFRKVALEIIDFLSQIEEFQKNIWEKKKFVIRTDYVITLDKIGEYAGEEFLESILDEILGNERQLEEWSNLLGLDIKKNDDLIEKSGNDGRKWKPLPLDTQYFSDTFRWKLLAALSKEHAIDSILDGVLVKSENWQALNLLLEKYNGMVRTIYIDPPFNKEREADYLYKVGYKDATWITMLENRIRLAREFLSDRGAIFVRCDYNGNMYVRLLLNEIFGAENFRNEIGVRRFKKNVMDKEIKKLPEGLDTIYVYAKDFEKFSYTKPFKMKSKKRGGFWRHMGDSSGQGTPKIFFGKELAPPPGKHWKYSQEKIDKMIEEGKLILQCKRCGYVHDKTKGVWSGCPVCGADEPQPKYWVEEKEVEVLDSNWSDIYGYSTTWGFQTENSEALLKRVIESTSNEGDFILDFFMGSGTTVSVAHKLRRRWLGVEMGEHFYAVILPRMKRVLFYDSTGISKEKDVKEKYNPQKSGGFFKYHTLEQYEDAIENIEFEDAQNAIYEIPDYFVKYMLEWESKKSKTFLKIEGLKDPFNYTLKVIEKYAQKAITVDLVETFNYLLGLHVRRYTLLNDGSRKYIFVVGVRDGKTVVVIWRSIENIDFDRDKEIIEKAIVELNPDEVYINGDASIRGYRPIEPLLKYAMLGGM